MFSAGGILKPKMKKHSYEYIYMNSVPNSYGLYPNAIDYRHYFMIVIPNINEKTKNEIEEMTKISKNHLFFSGYDFGISESYSATIESIYSINNDLFLENVLICKMDAFDKINDQMKKNFYLRRMYKDKQVVTMLVSADLISI